MAYHSSVLLRESIEALAIRPDGVYVDVTFGGGGHSLAILQQLTSGRLIAFDQDEDASRNQIDDPRFTLVNNNFIYLRNFLRLHKAIPVDGILADLGVSGHQFDEPSRGFSTRFDGLLDMRMDRRKTLTASNIINTYPAEELSRILYKYGEVDNAPRLAALIVEARNQGPVETTTALRNLANRCAPKGKEFQFQAKVFQALRMEVNQETSALETLLEQATSMLKPGGRLVVISYHSLEDKLVKNWMKTGNSDGILHKDFYGNRIVPYRLISNRPIMPSEDEIIMNNRARSARLRVAEKLPV
jgi:16S rRNA (cytosine1402-N4)-methyltransferase